MGDQGIGARVAWLTTALLLLPSATAWAAGGPYVVDDSSIDAPGECKIESWGSRSDTGDHLAVVSPACVVGLSLPLPIELGLNAQRSRTGGVYETLLGPKFKTELLAPRPHGIGVGMMLGAAYSTSRDRADSAAFAIPFTTVPFEELRLSVNLGWAWTRTDHRHAATGGVAAEWQVLERVAVTAEAYGRDYGRWAKQAGLRLIVIENLLDLDLVYGRNTDFARSNWVTLGPILRF
jgi:hypothetical protein